MQLETTPEAPESGGGHYGEPYKWYIQHSYWMYCIGDQTLICDNHNVINQKR